MRSLSIVFLLSLILLTVALREVKCQSSRISSIDSLNKVLSKSDISDTSRIQILNAIARKYFGINSNLVYENSKKALVLAIAINSKQGIALSHNTLGIYYWSVANYSAAIKNLLYSLDVYGEICDTAGIVKVRGNIAVVYYLCGMHEKGIQHHLEIKKINPNSRDTIAQIMNLINLAGGYSEIKDYTNALRYYNEANDIKMKLQTHGIDFFIYLNKAIVLSNLKRHDDAYTLLNKANSFKGDFVMDDVQRLTDYGTGYSSVVLSYYLDTNENKIKVSALENNKNKVLEDVKDKIRNSIRYYTSIEALNELKNIYFHYASLLKLQGNIDSSYHYYLLACEIKDTIQARNNVEAIRLIDVEREIAMQKYELAKQSEINSIHRKITYLLVVLALFLLTGVIYLKKILDKNKVLNFMLIEKNHEITQTNTELEALVDELSQKQIQIVEANDKLKIANQSKDRFFSIISHDLRSPFTGIIGLSDLIANDLDRIPHSELQNIGKAINTASKNTFAMLNSLLEWAKMQMGAIKYNPTICTVSSRIESIIPSLIDSANTKDIQIDKDTNAEIYINCDINMIDTVLRNLISNSIKFTNSGGRIIISALREDNYAKFIINDNGVGMSLEVMANLFNIEKVTSSKGTNSEVGTGLGLLLCKEFVDKHNGKIWAESEVGKGTTFCFTVPISE